MAAAEPQSRRRRPVDAEPRMSQRDWHAKAMHDQVDSVCDAWPRAVEDVSAIGFPGAVMQPRSSASSGSSSVEAAALRAFPDPDRPRRPVGDAVGWIAELHDVANGLMVAAWPARWWTPDWTPSGLRQVLHEAVDRVCADWQLDDLVDFDPASANYRSDVFGLGRLAGRALRHWPPPPKKGSREGEVTVGERGSQIESCTGCTEPIGGGRADPLKRIDGDPFHVKGPDGTWCYHQALRSRGRLGGQRKAG